MLSERLRWGIELCNMTPQEAEAVLSALQTVEGIEKMKNGVTIYPPSDSCSEWRCVMVGSLHLHQANSICDLIGMLK